MRGIRRKTPGEPLPSTTEADEPHQERAGILQEAAVTDEPDSGTGLAPGEHDVHFADFLAPFVRVGRRRLVAAAGPHLRGLAPGARAALEQALLRRLSDLASPALEVEAASFRAVRATFDAPSAGWLPPNRARALFVRLPGLGRILGTATRQWAASVAELLERLEADAALLDTELGGGAALGRVEGVEWGFSDPHRGGRTVAILEFASGLRVVYKPRGLGIEAAWQRLLLWLAEQDAGCRMRALRVLDRGSHGWMEWARADGPGTAEADARFHDRLGVLLCLVYALGGGDLHPGNVLRCGADPVLVDAEVMLGAPPVEDGAGAAAGAAAWDSVVRTHLLPGWRARPRASVVDERQLEALLGGFERAYGVLARCHDRLVAEDGPLRDLAANETRIVFRDTRRYTALLRRLLHPCFLSESGGWTREIGTLGAPSPGAPCPDRVRRQLRAERRDLARLDVPVFTTRPDSTHAFDAEGAPLGRTRVRPGVEEAVRRVRGLDAEDLGVQKRLVRLAFVRAGRFRADGDPLMGAARMIAEALGAAAAPCRDGIGWVGVLPARPGRRPRFGWIDPSLGHGCAGVVLFLAAYARVSGDGAARDLALRGARTVAAALRERADALRGAPALGAEFALGRAAVLLEAPSLVAEPGPGPVDGTSHLVSLATLLRLSPGEIPTDPAALAHALRTFGEAPLSRFDPPLGGNLGLVEALLTTSRRLDHRGLGDAASARGEEVVRRAARRGSFATGLRDVLTPGFHQGVAGIGYGLLRLRFPDVLPSALLCE